MSEIEPESQRPIIIWDLISISLIVFMIQAGTYLSTFIDVNLAAAAKGLAMVMFGISGMLLARLFFVRYKVAGINKASGKQILYLGVVGAAAIVIVQVVWVQWTIIMTPVELSVIDTVGSAIAAIAETCFFQVFLLMFMARIGFWKAVFLNAASFAVYHLAQHPGNLTALGGVFVSGIVLNWLMLTTNRPSIPMLAHLIFNVVLTLPTSLITAAILTYPLWGVLI